MTPDGAAAAIERFSTAVDLAEKDWLALRLAEGVVDEVFAAHGFQRAGVR
jgi:hypothetical protein